MKVLMINGSARPNGCTKRALTEVASELIKADVDVEIVDLGAVAIRDCTGCQSCMRQKNGRCVFGDDMVNDLIEKAGAADGFVFGSPVYFAHPSGRMLSLLDRLYYAGRMSFDHKPAAAVVSARRAGTTAALDVLNKHITYADALLVSSSYWNMVHGNTPEEVEQDIEGLATMRNLGKNMAWALKSVAAASKAGVETPDHGKIIYTNFIRKNK